MKASHAAPRPQVRQLEMRVRVDETRHQRDAPKVAFASGATCVDPFRPRLFRRPRSPPTVSNGGTRWAPPSGLSAHGTDARRPVECTMHNARCTKGRARDGCAPGDGYRMDSTAWQRSRALIAPCALCIVPCALRAAPPVRAAFPSLLRAGYLSSSIGHAGLALGFRGREGGACAGRGARGRTDRPASRNACCAVSG